MIVSASWQGCTCSAFRPTIDSAVSRYSCPERLVHHCDVLVLPGDVPDRTADDVRLSARHAAAAVHRSGQPDIRDSGGQNPELHRARCGAIIAGASQMP